MWQIVIALVVTGVIVFPILIAIVAITILCIRAKTKNRKQINYNNHER